VGTPLAHIFSDTLFIQELSSVVCGIGPDTPVLPEIRNLTQFSSSWSRTLAQIDCQALAELSLSDSQMQPPPCNHRVKYALQLGYIVQLK